jgi:pimeloyl-ACP methyl ester carboxylesterase
VPPPILYARSGETSVAYQVVGDGPSEMLMIPGWFSHLALDWEEPTWVRWCERLATFARLVRFDKRGNGMSDRPEGIPTPDERMEDARAVMDAARMDGVLRGISVHLAARVMAEAAGGEVFVSETVKDIIAGSALRFEDRGTYELKGIEGQRRLFAVARPAD